MMLSREVIARNTIHRSKTIMKHQNLEKQHRTILPQPFNARPHDADRKLVSLWGYQQDLKCVVRGMILSREVSSYCSSNALGITTEREKEKPHGKAESSEPVMTINPAQQTETTEPKTQRSSKERGGNWSTRMIRFAGGDATGSSASDHHPLNHRQEAPGS